MKLNEITEAKWVPIKGPSAAKTRALNDEVIAALKQKLGDKLETRFGDPEIDWNEGAGYFQLRLNGPLRTSAVLSATREIAKKHGYTVELEDGYPGQRDIAFKPIKSVNEAETTESLRLSVISRTPLKLSDDVKAEIAKIMKGSGPDWTHPEFGGIRQFGFSGRKKFTPEQIARLKELVPSAQVETFTRARDKEIDKYQN